MKFNRELDIVTYLAVTERIAENFFDVDGKYQPHYGMMNAMAVFYENCVDKNTVGNLPKEINGIEDINAIASNESFIRTFNRATENTGYGIDFANAFCNALDIVDDRKSNIRRVVDTVNSAITAIDKNLKEMITPEAMEDVSKIAKMANSPEEMAELIVQKYGKAAFRK